MLKIGATFDRAPPYVIGLVDLTAGSPHFGKAALATIAFAREGARPG
jgi:hypothetical protein